MAYAGVMHDEWTEQRGSEFVDKGVGSEDRMYATFLNLVPLITLTGAGWLVSIIVAVIMWRIKAKSSHFLDDHGKEVFNFLISLFVWTLILIISSIVVTIVTVGIGAIFMVVVAVVMYLTGVIVILAGSIRGAIAANNGRYHRYPVTFRFIQ